MSSAPDASADSVVTGRAPAVATRKRPKPGERRVQILQVLAEMLQQPGAERVTTAALAARASAGRLTISEYPNIDIADALKNLRRFKTVFFPFIMIFLNGILLSYRIVPPRIYGRFARATKKLFMIKS